MRSIFADLHTHTHFSDGLYSPTVLLEKAADRGIQVLAVTDHDTIAGLDEAATAAKHTGIDLISGVELTVSVGEDVVHLLGYGFDPSNPALVAYLDGFREGRRDRMAAMVARLTSMGVDVTMDQVEAEAEPAASLGRPHLARVLVQNDDAPDLNAAFDRFLGNEAPAYVPAPGPSAPEAIEVVHQAGGIVSIAHPGQWMSGHVLRALRRAGVDAIECISPSHPDYLVDYYRTKVRTSELMMTGGSDFHGGSERQEENLGRLGLSYREWEMVSGHLARQAS
jgi:hypothetical protein